MRRVSLTLRYSIRKWLAPPSMARAPKHFRVGYRSANLQSTISELSPPVNPLSGPIFTPSSTLALSTFFLTSNPPLSSHLPPSASDPSRPTPHQRRTHPQVIMSRPLRHSPPRNLPRPYIHRILTSLHLPPESPRFHPPPYRPLSYRPALLCMRYGVEADHSLVYPTCLSSLAETSTR